MKYSNETYIEKANKIHNNKYDYSLLKYDGVNKKIKIICPVHGEFEQIADNHIRKKYGCPKCVGKGLNKEEYIKKFNFIFLNKYDYILLKKLIKYNSIIKVICPIHGEFETKPYIHIRGHGCPKCKESKGEREIRLFLENNNIKFDYQFKFKKCKNKKELPFDFFVKDLNLCIEFDGEQHFKAFEIFGGEKKFKEIKINDNIKNNFCKQNNINLIRISYKDIKNINEILWKEINKKK
jgi:very-short-patch-repair endonuclease